MAVLNWSVVAVSLLALSLSVPRLKADAVDPATPPSGRYSLSLEVTEEEGIHHIEVQITDLESGKLLFAPQIRTSAGEEATLRMEGVNHAVTLSVSVGSNQLQYRFEGGIDGEVATIQEGSILISHESSLAIDLANNSPSEIETKAQLLRLLREKDLSKWIFTRAILIDEKVRIPHSHPILTVDTENLASDVDFLGMFVHEQLHWFEESHPQETRKAIEELEKLYPNAPSGHPEGARNLYSTYLHLVLCFQEYEGLKELVGAEKATNAFEAKGYYTWIYRTVLADMGRIRAIVEKHGLAL